MSQEKQIINYLSKPGRSLTPIQALEKFGCFRLSARVYDLNKLGHNIQTGVVTKNKKRFARYYLKF